MPLTQTPNLVAMLGMTGHQKKLACDKFKIFESQLGTERVNALLKCSSKYKSAHTRAKAHCENRDGPGKSVTTSPDPAKTCNTVICNIAKAQVRLDLYVFLYMNATMI